MRLWVLAQRPDHGLAIRLDHLAAAADYDVYLLFDNAERRPLNAPSNHVDARLADLDDLSDEECTTIANVIDALVTKTKLRLITG